MNELSPLILLGLSFVFLIIELTTLSFYMIYFAISTVIVACLTFLGTFVGLDNIFFIQIITICFISLLGIFTSQKQLKKFINKSEKVIEDKITINPNLKFGIFQNGKVEYQGTVWNFRFDNENENIEIKDNEKVFILRIEGNELIIEKH